MSSVKLLLLLSLLIFLPSDGLANPKTTWSPSNVSCDVLVGTTTSFQVSFTSSETLSNVAIRVVPELARVMSISPSNFAVVNAGLPQTITVVVSIPMGISIATLNGTLQIQSVSGNVSRPLPISITPTVATNTFIPNGVALPSADRLEKDGEDRHFSYVRDEMNVFFDQGTSLEMIKTVAANIGGVFLGGIPELDFYQIQVQQTGFDSLSALIDQVSQMPGVAGASHHFIGTFDADPFDPNSFGTYSYALIRLPEAWDVTVGKKRVGPSDSVELGIGVMDSSFDFLHKDLKPNIAANPLNTGA
jgi:hypothetical protein